jgi:hypothetical protein
LDYKSEYVVQKDSPDLRNGIVPAFVQRVTACDPSNTHPAAAAHTVPLDRLSHEFRTRRFEATDRSQDRRNDPLIYHYKPHH